MGTSPVGKQTFETLNGMRGIAAVAVVMMHFQWFLGGLHPAIVSLAVDFFFVLSGFVIAYAYEAELRSGMRRRDFLLARLIRLYPMFLAGIVLGGFAVWNYEPPEDVRAFYANIAFNLFMAPYPLEYPARNDDLFPLNFPAWSLFFEMIAYALFALLVPKLSRRWLVTIIAIGFVALVVTGFTQGTLDRGVWRPSWPGGLARVTFSFFAGVALYRLWLERPVRTNVHPLIVFLLLAAPLLWRPPPELEFSWLYELAVITVWMPLLVFLGTASMARGVWKHTCEHLGAISYPLYILHAPLILVAINFNGRQGDAFFKANAPWAGFAFIGCAVAFAWLAARYIDAPIRKRLAKRFIPHRRYAFAVGSSVKPPGAT